MSNYDFNRRKRLPDFPSVFGPVSALANDPARFKSSFVGASGVNPGYASRVAAFNKDLYQPQDTKPGTSAMPRFSAPGVALSSNGFETPGFEGAGSIVSKYQTPGTGRASGFAATAEPLPPVPQYDIASDGKPWAGTPDFPPALASTATTQLTGNSSLPELSHPDTSGYNTGSSGNGQITPQDQTQKAKDLFISQGGSQHTWNQKATEAGVRPAIDARASASPRNGGDPAAAIREKWGWGVDTSSLPY